jgi:hypothetical protein
VEGFKPYPVTGLVGFLNGIFGYISVAITIGFFIAFYFLRRAASQAGSSGSTPQV